MCGIAGLWDPDKKLEIQNTSLMESLVAPIRTRGPDHCGTLIDQAQGLILAHTRLSIVDTSEAGNQPFVNRKGNKTIIFNGEIYNHKELRSLLIEKQSLRGTSDTEVFLELIEQEGIQKALSLSKGMFAFALWDQEENTIYLSRDLNGEKPLYFSIQDNIAVFGSDPRSFSFIRSLTPSKSAALCFLEYGYCLPSYQIFEGVYSLHKGSCLAIKKLADGSLFTHKIIIEKTPQFKKEQIAGISEGACLNLFEKVLTESIEKHLEADVEVGAFLSGGADSSLVCAIAARLGKKPKAFNIGFDDANFDESQRAQEIAKHLGLEITSKKLTKNDIVSLIPELLVAYPEPLADPSCLPTLAVCRLASKSLKVVITGDGADEHFGGYDRYRLAQKLMTLGLFTPKWAIQLAQSSVQAIKNDGMRTKRDKILKGLQALKNSNAIHRAYPAVHRISPLSSELILDKKTISKQWLVNSEPTTDYQYMLNCDQNNYLPANILVKTDRASMHYGLELRSPFLYQDVIEFAAALPEKFKKGKILNKRLLEKYLPEHLIKGPKKGFGIPLDTLLRKELKNFLVTSLTPEKAENAGLDSTTIQKLIREHLSGQRNWHYVLWAAICWTNWYNTYENVSTK